MIWREFKRWAEEPISGNEMWVKLLDLWRRGKVHGREPLTREERLKMLRQKYDNGWTWDEFCKYAPIEDIIELFDILYKK